MERGEAPVLPLVEERVRRGPEDRVRRGPGCRGLRLGCGEQGASEVGRASERVAEVEVEGEVAVHAHHPDVDGQHQAIARVLAERQPEARAADVEQLAHPFDQELQDLRQVAEGLLEPEEEQVDPVEREVRHALGDDQRRDPRIEIDGDRGDELTRPLEHGVGERQRRGRDPVGNEQGDDPRIRVDRERGDGDVDEPDRLDRQVQGRRRHAVAGEQGDHPDIGVDRELLAQRLEGPQRLPGEIERGDDDEL